jgi:hypothetical protein
MNDEEVDVTCRVTFTTPQNVLNHNTLIINNVKYTLNLEGDYKTPAYFAQVILTSVNEQLNKKVYQYDTNVLDSQNKLIIIS